MKKVIRYALYPDDGVIQLKLPKGYKTLHVAWEGEIFLWALVDPLAETEDVRFLVVGSEIAPDNLGEFIGTYGDRAGLWHVFHAKPVVGEDLSFEDRGVEAVKKGEMDRLYLKRAVEHWASIPASERVRVGDRISRSVVDGPHAAATAVLDLLHAAAKAGVGGEAE